MAFRMKWALALVVLTIALTLALGRGGPHGTRLEEYAAQSHLWRASNELDATRRAIAQWSVLASVRGLVPDSGVRFDASGAIDAGYDIFAEARDSIEAELAAMGGSRARIAVVALTGAERPDARRPTISVQYFADRDSLGGWCAVVIDPHAADPDGLRDAIFAGGSALGPCAFWARYGAPGPAVASLLPHFGLFLSAPRPAPPAEEVPGRGLFGVRHWGAELAPHVVAQACVAGRMEACARALNDPSTWTASFFGTLRSPDDAALLARRRSDRDISPQGRLMADLKQDVGDEAFTRFWRANGDMNQALAAATGLPAPAWMHRWAAARFGTEPRGPTVDALTALLTVLAIAALAAASLHVARRRRVT